MCVIFADFLISFDGIEFVCAYAIRILNQSYEAIGNILWNWIKGPSHEENVDIVNTQIGER
jgi:hypothetical protein